MMAHRQPLTPGTLFLVVAALLCALLTAWAAFVNVAFAPADQLSTITPAVGSGLVLVLAICMATLAISRLPKGPLGPLMAGLSTLIGAGFFGLGLWSIWQDPGDAVIVAPSIFAIGAIFVLLALQSRAARQS